MILKRVAPVFPPMAIKLQGKRIGMALIMLWLINMSACEGIKKSMVYSWALGENEKIYMR